MTKARLAVVGPGAIGTTIAAMLHEAGRTPTLFGRTPRDRLVLRIHDEQIVVPGPVHTDPALADGPSDLIFLAVKSTQVRAAAPWLRALAGPDTVVCVLQNGVEQEQMIRPFCPDSAIVPSVVWFPSQSEVDGSVRLRGDARLTVPDVSASRTVVEALRDTRCAVEQAPDFAAAAWHKLLRNAVVGLMVLTGRRAGMFARDDIGELALAYLRECLAVARAEGADLGDDVPEEILATVRSFPPDLGTSILADREANRPLEWDIRNGVIRRRARVHGIPTPISDLVVPLLAAASEGPG